MKSSPENQSTSPRWSNTAKLIAAILFLGICILLVIRFQYIIAPLLASLLLAYILQPAAAFFNKKLKISWRLSVSLVYVIFVLLLIGLLVWGGATIIKQTINLINSLITAIRDLPNSVSDFFKQTIVIGSFKLDLSTVDISSIQQNIVNFVTNTVTWLTTLATDIGKGAFSFIGWMFFAILISYFLLHETTGITDQMIDINIPNYREDIKKLTHELDKVWNAFLRRQLLIFVIILVIFSVFLGLLKVNGFFWLALLAALSRYVPYIGPFVSFVTIGIVAYFQGSTIFGMTSLSYTIMVLAISYILDNIIDLIIVTRLMSDALFLHPAAAMLAAFLMLNWLGIIGMILSAPILATLILIVKYLWYKYNDQDPWEHIKLMPHKSREPRPYRWLKALFSKIAEFMKQLFSKRKRKPTKQEVPLLVKTPKNPRNRKKEKR
jgi:predicted PurR-regulated permease PerM